MKLPDLRMYDDDNDYPQLTIQAIRAYTNRIEALETDKSCLKEKLAKLHEIANDIYNWMNSLKTPVGQEVEVSKEGIIQTPLKTTEAAIKNYDQ